MNLVHISYPVRPGRVLGVLACLALAFSLVACGTPARDYVIVIDTSGSMSLGRQKTIAKVKQSMSAFMETVNPGDTVSLLSFDQSARLIGTFRIDSAADRAAPVAAVQGLDAWGRHTFMKAMVASVRDMVRDLEGQGRQVIVVIMSDGKDDPPPGQAKNRLELSAIESPDAGVNGRKFDETFIYYVSLGKLKDPALEAELEKLSGAVKTVQPKTTGVPADVPTGRPADEPAAPGASDIRDPRTAVEDSDSPEAGVADAGSSRAAAEELGLTEVAEDIQSRSWYDQLRQVGKVVAPIIFGVLLLVWLVRKFRNRHKVGGTIQYYEADVGSPIKNSYALDKLGKSAMTIGSKLGADLRVRQSGLPHNIKLKAIRKGGENFLKPVGKDQQLFKFLKQQKSGFVSKGDSFRLGNYIFEYGDGET